MAEEIHFDEINEAKAEMGHIYDRTDPRAYFRELSKLDYVIPAMAAPVFTALMAALEEQRARPLSVLDVGCSYGVNAAMLKHDVGLSALYAHWARDDVAAASTRAVITRDQQFFADLPRRRPVTVVGLDAAANAVGYGQAAGLLDHGVVGNLEHEPLPTTAIDVLAGVDLVVSTGCVGYVTERSFEALLPAVTKGEAPWMAHFVLRMFPFDAVADALSDWGYATEKLDRITFVQRRFADDGEQREVLGHLRSLGIDPTGREALGQLHAELYVSRPKDDVRRAPLRDLIST